MNKTVHSTNQSGRTRFFFKHEQTASSSKEKVLKDNCQLFSRLFISCHNRQTDLQEFFKHENQSAPASLSDSGRLRMCQKSQLVDILQITGDFARQRTSGGHHHH